MPLSAPVSSDEAFGMEAPRSSAGRLLRLTLALAIGMGLAALVLRKSLAAYVAPFNPGVAIVFDPGSAAAHLRLAEAAVADIRGVQPPLSLEDRDRLAAAAEASALAALEKHPISAQAIRILGEVALIRGDRERADQLIAAAASLNRHEYSALLLDAQRSWEGEDILRALNASDALLRTRPDLNRALFSAIAGLAESPAGRAIVKQRLSERPPWRDLFLASMYGGVRDATLPLDLMLHLKTSGVTIPQHAVNAYVEWLLSNRIYGFAYTAWLQLLDRERLLKVGFVYNGDFNAPLTGSPFDWTIRRGTGVSVEIADLPETKDNRALKIEMSTSRAQFGEVYQRLNLAPGDYVLTGRYRGEFAGRRGLQWRILCAEASQAQLAQTQMLIGQFKTWREFSIPVAIPPQGCTSQILRLVHDARYSAEQFGSGLIWFDDLRIARAMRTGAAPMAAEQSSVDRSGAPP